MRVEENVSLKDLTTFKTGGSARFLITAVISELPEARDFAKKQDLPILPLGSGSNILAPDENLNAVLLRLSSDSIVATVENDYALLQVDAGASWDTLVQHAVDNEWWGIENLSAIPGTVGAAVVQNIGAYGAVLGDSIVSVDAFDLLSGEQKKITREDIGFGYRTSLFKREPDRFFIQKVLFRLGTTTRPKVEYRDLASHFTNSNEDPTLNTIRTAVMRIRAEKFPPLSEYGTAGSFFLNPVLPADEAQRMKAQFPAIPLFPMPEGGVKVPLAWILDHVLSLKGKRKNNAFLWPAQPLVITAERGASSDEVIALAQFVKEEVKKKTGIEISPEVRVLSFEKKYL